MQREPVLARRGVVAVLGLSLALGGCARVKSLSPGEALTPRERQEAIRRAGVWSHTNIPSVDLEAGPRASGAFAPNQWVTSSSKSFGGQGSRHSSTHKTPTMNAAPDAAS